MELQLEGGARIYKQDKQKESWPPHSAVFTGRRLQCWGPSQFVPTWNTWALPQSKTCRLAHTRSRTWVGSTVLGSLWPLSLWLVFSFKRSIVSSIKKKNHKIVGFWSCKRTEVWFSSVSHPILFIIMLSATCWIIIPNIYWICTVCQEIF